MKKLYLDTCVISNYVMSDMKHPADARALPQIANYAKSGNLALYSSTVALEELNDIPDGHRGDHLDIYSTLSTVRGSTAWLGENYHIPEDHPDFQALSIILHDRNDARQIWLAMQAGIKTFITIDEKTILSKSSELKEKCGMNVCSPSDFINTFNIITKSTQKPK